MLVSSEKVPNTFGRINNIVSGSTISLKVEILELQKSVFSSIYWIAFRYISEKHETLDNAIRVIHKATLGT